MDGGRVLRAILSPIVGWWKASHVVIVVGRLFAILFVVAAVVTWSMNLLIVGGFLLFATGVEGRSTDIMQGLLTLALLIPPAIIFIRDRRRARAATSART